MTQADKKALCAFIVLCVLAVLAAAARADDNSAFVDQQIAKIQAADKVRHQIASTGNAVFFAESGALEALGARGVGIDRDPQLRKLYEDKVIPFLIRSLAEESTRASVADALEKIGAATLPPLLQAIAHDAQPEVRAGVAQALGTIRPRSREALPALIAALHDADAMVRYRAGYSLTDFALVFQEARAPLIQALGDYEVREAVTYFANDYRPRLERDAPEILRALEARRDASPMHRIAGWLYHGCMALAVLSLITFFYGMFFRSRGDGTIQHTAGELLPVRRLSRTGPVTPLHKIFAWTRGISWSFSESMDISDMIEGLKVGDRESIDFACRGVALLSFGLSTFLAFGFGMVYYGQDGGWVFVGFILLFMIMIECETALSYRLRKTRVKEGAKKVSGRYSGLNSDL